MKRIAIVMAVIALGMSLPLPSGSGRGTPESSVGELRVAAAERSGKADRDVDELMRQKLQHSQKVLEGIAVNDFDTIGHHAEELILISKKAEWMVYKTPPYEVHSNEFRRNAGALVKGAKDKNLDACALAYVDLTLCCVRCHKYVREVRMARRD
jgi:hypothetical protein